MDFGAITETHRELPMFARIKKYKFLSQKTQEPRKMTNRLHSILTSYHLDTALLHLSMNAMVNPVGDLPEEKKRDWVKKIAVQKWRHRGEEGGGQGD